MSKLADQFYKEKGIPATNSQGEPDLEYVSWLEDKIDRFTTPDAVCTCSEAICRYRSETEPDLCLDPTDICLSKKPPEVGRQI